MKIALLLALSLCATPALAADRTKTGAAANGRKKMICVEDTIVGSRLATKRVCKTAEEWKQERMDARQLLEKANTTQTNPVG